MRRRVVAVPRPAPLPDPRPATVPGSGWLGLVRLAPAATVATVLLSVLAEGVTLLLPVLSAAALDRVVTGRTPGWALVALAGLLALRALAEAGGGVARVAAATRVSARLRHRLVRHVFALGVRATRRHDTGDLVARLTGNAAVAGTAVPALVTAAVAVTASVGGTVALWLIDWRLGAVYLAGVAPAVFLLRLLMGRATGSYADYLHRLSLIAARLTDALAGARTIRACRTEDREVARVLGPLPELAAAGRATWAVQRAVSWQLDLVLVCVRVVVLAVAGLGVAAGRLTPGDLLAAAMYLTSALAFLSQVDALVRIAEARANAGRVTEVLADSPAPTDSPAPAARASLPDQPSPAGRVAAAAGPLPPGPGALSFRGVRVRLGERAVLDGVDLHLPAGSAVAVVGRSGAGKSTLALTVGRLVPVDAGQVLIDGVPVTDRDPDAVRREVGYAFDRPVLLGDTVRDAVGYGRAELTDPQLWRALRLAQAAEFVRRLPGGLDAPLATAPFSGGERQRLGLARAIVHGGRVLVLDDATSSLDTVTEARVTAAITGGLAGCTRLVVAHRTATAARADLVAWLDAGRIRAVAPHAELWRREAAYRSIFAADPLPDEEPLPEEEP